MATASMAGQALVVFDLDIYGPIVAPDKVQGLLQGKDGFTPVTLRIGR